MPGKTPSHSLLVLVFLALPAFAQTEPAPIPAFQLDRVELDSSAVGSLTTGSGQVLPRGSFRIFAALHYQRNPLWVAVNGVPTSALVSDRFGIHLGGDWAVYDRLELFLQIPVVLYQGGNDGTLWGYTSPQSAGLGAPSLGARYQILRASPSMPLDLAGELALALPIGSNLALANDPGLGLTPRFSAGVDAWYLRLSADVGVKIRPTVPVGTGELGPQLNWGLSVARRGEGVRPELALRSGIGFTKVDPSVEILAGLRYPIGNFELFLLGGPGLGTAPGTPAFRLLFGGAWNPPAAPVCVEGQPYEVAQCPELDLDHDGVINRLDRCPREPEDHDGFEDADGCPDPDNDRDGIPDEKDRCPNKAGPASNGGCPVLDQDHDGIPDADDACPTEAGPADHKGCPVRDTDGDGVEDDKDECPKEPGPVERKGCPVRDQDEDGVPDEVDNCPKEKGPASNQGCPEKEKQLVVITREKLVIKDKVYFESGKSTIQPRSFGLLDQIARVLVEHPDIKQIRVEGHTDNKGSAGLNRRLSQGRADAVRDYLVKKKVEASRLTAVGYGPDRPASDNSTWAGREANRRVEFVIVDDTAKPEVTP